MNQPGKLVAVTLAACLLAGCGEDSPQDLLMEGMQKAASGDYDGALVILDRSVAMEPNNVSLLIVRAGLHDSLGDPAAAVADYEKVLALAPDLAPGLSMQLDFLREQVAILEQVQGVPGAAPAADSATEGPTLTNVTFCSSEPESYGNYQEQPGASYRAGQTAWIYLDVHNLEARTSEDGQIENSLRQSIELRDPWGRLLMEEVVVDEVRTIPWRKDPDRLFLRNHIAIPSSAPAGEYSVELLLEDRFAGAKTKAAGHFTVSP